MPRASQRPVAVDHTDVAGSDRDLRVHGPGQHIRHERQPHHRADDHRDLRSGLVARRGRTLEANVDAADFHALIPQSHPGGQPGRGLVAGGDVDPAGLAGRLRDAVGRALHVEHRQQDVNQGNQQQDPEEMELDDRAAAVRASHAAHSVPSSTAWPLTVSPRSIPSHPNSGNVAVTRTSTNSTPPVPTYRELTSSTESADSDSAISTAVRASPSASPRSALAAYRAPSAAQATSVFRTCTTSPTWRTARNRPTSTTDTSVNSTTADPRWSLIASLRSNSLKCPLQDVAQIRLGELPQHGHDASRHDRDQDPARDVPTLVAKPGVREGPAEAGVHRHAHW